MVGLCGTAAGELTPAGIVQFFIGTPHEAAVADALATAEDQALTPDLAGERLRAGVDRYWQQAERAGTAKAPRGGRQHARRSASGCASSTSSAAPTTRPAPMHATGSKRR